MINIIWLMMILAGIMFGMFTGQVDSITASITSSSETAVTLVIGLVGILSFWSGIMKIAQESGLTKGIARVMEPVLRVLFRKEGRKPEAMGSIVMNLSTNMMGVSNAATPFGIKAMKEMEDINPKKGVATNDMVLFLVLNAACIQLVPTTIIGIRSAAGSANPGIIILPAIITTSIAAITGVVVCRLLEKVFR